jgi:serine/threonine protein kinase
MSGTIRVESKNCPRCGAPIPGEAPRGLCPKCLLARAAAPTEAGDAASPAADPPHPDELKKAFPQLEILELIGRGGMGFVFKARQPRLERLVALKILPQTLACDPAFAERFAREGRVLARLNHPNIVAVYDFGQAGGFFYLMMEFVDGVNLRQAMRAGRFTPAQALGVVPKICEALQFAHDEGILHRDIKPENILLDAKGRIKIADFGIAKLLGAGAGTAVSAAMDKAAARLDQDHLTETGKVFGTPHYMAPEQVDNPTDVDERADIYSLGVVFYEMLTGELPLGRFAPPSAKSQVDARVDEIVLKALEKEREHRQRSAGEVKTQVETVAQTPSAERLRSPARKPVPADRFWRRFAIGSAAVIVAFTLVPVLYIMIGVFVPAWQRARLRTTALASNSAALATNNDLALQSLPASSPDLTNKIKQIRLHIAEQQLAEATKGREAGVITELQFYHAKLDRDLALAELNGDAETKTMLYLQFREKAFEVAKTQHEAGVVPAAEYNRAKLDRDVAALNALAEAKKRLDGLLTKFTDTHPAVVAQRQKIAAIQRQLNATGGP